MYTVQCTLYNVHYTRAGNASHLQHKLQLISDYTPRNNDRPPLYKLLLDFNFKCLIIGFKKQSCTGLYVTDD